MIPPAEAYGVASFYAMFSMTQRPATVVHECDDLACRTAGAEELCAELERSYGPAGTPGPDGGVTWARSPCLGLCEKAPAALFQQAGQGKADFSLAPIDVDAVKSSLDGKAFHWERPISGSVPQVGRPGLRLLKRVGVVDPESLDDYRAHGGYTALRRALEIGPHEVIREVTDSKLMGRGGA